MSKKQEIVQYINPLNLSLTSYDGKEFKSIDKATKNYTISKVSYEDVITYSFKVPITQLSEELESTIEIKMYEEAGLNLEKNYKITYITKILDYEEMALIEIFAVDTDKLSIIFKDIVKKTKYIDFLAIPFLAFSTFYTNEILKPKNDVFFYLGENEAFISFYKNGLYISTKSVTSLSKIIKQLHNDDIEIDIKKLDEILHSKGLNKKVYKDDEEILIYNTLEKIFIDTLTTMNSVAMHNRNVFGFTQIDRLFFSTDRGRVPYFKEFAINFGFADIKISDFNLFAEKYEDNFFDNVIASYGFDKYITNSDEQNISIFIRPPLFYKTISGQLILAILTLILILSSIYLYYYININGLQNKKGVLDRQYSKFEKKIKKYKISIAKIDKNIAKIQNNINNNSKAINHIRIGMNTIAKKQNSKINFADFIASVNYLLAKYKLHVNHITQIGYKHLDIRVIADSQNRNNISKFIKALIASGFHHVHTDEIKLDKDNYVSEIGIDHE